MQHKTYIYICIYIYIYAGIFQILKVSVLWSVFFVSKQVEQSQVSSLSGI